MRTKNPRFLAINLEKSKFATKKNTTINRRTSYKLALRRGPRVNNKTWSTRNESSFNNDSSFHLYSCQLFRYTGKFVVAFFSPTAFLSKEEDKFASFYSQTDTIKQHRWQRSEKKYEPNCHRDNFSCSNVIVSFPFVLHRCLRIQKVSLVLRWYADIRVCEETRPREMGWSWSSIRIYRID